MSPRHGISLRSGSPRSGAHRSDSHPQPARPSGQHRPAIAQRNARVAQYRELVRPIARHYQNRSPEPLDDLIQVGLLGLLRAAELYQDTRQTPFSAFARPHIRGAILHYLRDQARPVRLSRGQMELEDRLRQLKREPIEQRPGVAQADQWRQRLGLTQSQWQQFLLGQRLARPCSLEELGVDPAEQSDVASTQGHGEELIALVNTLSPRRRQAVQLVVLTGLSLRRAAQQLQSSPSTVQRDLRKGLAELKERFELISSPCRRAPSAAAGC